MRHRGEQSKRWLAVYEEIIGHTGVMIILLASIWCIKTVFDFFFGKDAMFFSVIPFKWIVDGADLFIFIALSYAGTMSAIRAYRGEQ